MRIPKLVPGPWSQQVPANEGLVVLFQGREWALTGAEHGSNGLGTHFLHATSGADKIEIPLAQIKPTTLASQILRQSLEFTKKSQSFLATKNAALNLNRS